MYTKDRKPHEDVVASYEKIKKFLADSPNLSDDQKDCLANLFNYLDTSTEWKTAYCSTRFHGAYEGGLLEHSVNVVNVAMVIAKALAPDIRIGDIIIIALLHDCGKAFQYKRKEPTERQRQYGYPGSMSINEDIPYMEHEDRSLFIITQYYPYLTEEMYCAIAQHNEPWLTNTCQFKECREMTILQQSDYWCCCYLDAPAE